MAVGDSAEDGVKGRLLSAMPGEVSGDVIDVSMLTNVTRAPQWFACPRAVDLGQYKL